MPGDRTSALLSRLASLMVADSLEDSLALATDLLAEVTGASAVGLLVQSRDRFTSEHWRGADEALRDRARPFLTTDLKDYSVQESLFDDPTPLRLRTSSCDLGGQRLCLALAYNPQTDEQRQSGADVDRIVEIVAAKLRGDRKLATSRAELTQTQRWFDMLDSQMRVLDRERQKFAAVVGQSDTLMFVSDKRWVAQWTNAALKARLEELGSPKVAGLRVGQIWDLLRVDNPPPGSSGCPIARVFSDGAVFHVESRQGGQESEERGLYLTLLPIKAIDGATAEVLVMIQDLSDLDILRRSEARYRLLFERSPDAMIMVEPRSGSVLLANPAASDLTGYTAQDLSALTLADLHEPQDWPLALEAYAGLVDRNADERRVERRLRSKQGAVIVANVTTSRFDLGGRQVTLLVLQDVTKQRELEAELRHSQKMEAIGRLAAGVTHEFNNVMTVILAEAEMLRIQAGGDPGLEEIADTTEKAANRAALLTRKMLAFARKEVTDTRVLDLNEVCRSIEGMLRDLLGERITLHTRFENAPQLIVGDRSQLEEIVINLTVNARDAMVKGGNFWLEITRRAPTHGSPEQVLLTARDDGVGMDPETLARIFEPFFTTKAPHAGTGLGMSTIKRIIDSHEGTIEVESEPGAGSTFLIAFPRQEMPGWTADVVASPETWRARGEERILVVDDVDEVRSMAAQLLELDGYSVDVAASAQQALASLEDAAHPYHLLLTDVVMPEMTGGELSVIVLRRYPETRVLFMSGYTDEELVQHGVSSSDTGFLRKPFTRTTLSRKVRDLLDG